MCVCVFSHVYVRLPPTHPPHFMCFGKWIDNIVMETSIFYPYTMSVVPSRLLSSRFLFSSFFLSISLSVCLLFSHSFSFSISFDSLLISVIFILFHSFYIFVSLFSFCPNCLFFSIALSLSLVFYSLNVSLSFSFHLLISSSVSHIFNVSLAFFSLSFPLFLLLTLSATCSLSLPLCASLYLSLCYSFDTSYSSPYFPFPSEFLYLFRLSITLCHPPLLFLYLSLSPPLYSIPYLSLSFTFSISVSYSLFQSLSHSLFPFNSSRKWLSSAVAMPTACSPGGVRREA